MPAVFSTAAIEAVSAPARAPMLTFPEPLASDFVHILEGTPILATSAGEMPLRPGMCAYCSDSGCQLAPSLPFTILPMPGKGKCSE